MVALFLHVIAITGPRLDSVALTSGRMQRVCTQFPYQGSRHQDVVALTSERCKLSSHSMYVKESWNLLEL
jgi:hypothetical protein